MKISKILTIMLLTTLPAANAFAFTDRTLVSYVTGNLVWRAVIDGGTYSVGIFIGLAVIALLSKYARHLILSLLMALCALFLFVLMYEVVEEMAWVAPIPGS
jgi:VIT1/CCC1 family predicted Fe2+/Mn2+ transporter